MQKIERLKGEILDLKGDLSHRSCLRIFSILESNTIIFSEHLDADYFQLILKNFEEIAHKSPREYGTARYKEEFEKNFENLSFHLNRL